jgi:hypothetical protein
MGSKNKVFGGLVIIEVCSLSKPDYEESVLLLRHFICFVCQVEISQITVQFCFALCTIGNSSMSRGVLKWFCNV